MKTEWYNNGVVESLIHEGQDIPEGFVPGRIHKESEIEKLAALYSKEYIYKLYIIDNLSYDALFEKLNISRSQLRKLLTLYKIHKNPTARAKNNTYVRPPEVAKEVGRKGSITQREKWINKTEEEKQAWREKQKKAHSTESFRKKSSEINKEYRKMFREKFPDIDKDRNERRKASSKKAWQNPELYARKKATERANRKARQCRSASEQRVFEALKKDFPDTCYDIRVDDRYPYYCDFYIPSLDIFIELQAHPSHGRLPIEFLEVDEYSKYPNKWVDVFARRDVDKINKARESKINLIRIYPNGTLEENYRINNDKFEDIITLCYKSHWNKAK